MSEQCEVVRTSGASRAQLATDLKARYEQGATIRTLAETTGRSYGFIHDLLGEAGVALRSRGRSAARAQPS